jgi:hypothetical protein
MNRTDLTHYVRVAFCSEHCAGNIGIDRIRQFEAWVEGGRDATVIVHRGDSLADSYKISLTVVAFRALHGKLGTIAEGWAGNRAHVVFPVGECTGHHAAECVAEWREIEELLTDDVAWAMSNVIVNVEEI